MWFCNELVTWEMHEMQRRRIDGQKNIPSAILNWSRTPAQQGPTLTLENARNSQSEYRSHEVNTHTFSLFE